MRLTQAVPLLKPLTLLLTFTLTLLTFALTLHPELLHHVQCQRDDLKLGAYQLFPLLRLFGFRPLLVSFVRPTLNFRLPGNEVQPPLPALSGCELSSSKMRPFSSSGPAFTVITALLRSTASSYFYHHYGPAKPVRANGGRTAAYVYRSVNG